MVFFIIHLSCDKRIAFLGIFLTFHSDTNLSASKFFNNWPVQCYLSKFSAFNPRRCFDLIFLNTKIELDLEPKSQSICFSPAEKLKFKNSINFDDFLIADFLKIKGQDFCNLCNNQIGVYNSNHRLMRNPLFHRGHWNAIDIIPKLYFMIVEMFIMNNCAFERKFIWKHHSSFYQKQISSLYHSIQHSIKMHTIAHRLTNYDIHFMIEIFPRQHLYVVLMIVFFDYLSHHVDILSLALTIAINYAIDLSATCFNSEKGIQTIYSFSQVKNCFSFEQISVLCHCIMVCFM